jgi:hypothetical protein
LQYTSPSDPSLIDAGKKDKFPDAWKAQNNEEKITTEQFSDAKGSISAGGIKVDTSNRATKQSIDTANAYVQNEVDLDFGHVCVGGTFRKSEKVSNRVVVSFDKVDISLNNGPTLKLGFLFNLSALLKGRTENGWLETTYIDDNMRIGRGNKGKMIVLSCEVLKDECQYVLE